MGGDPFAINRPAPASKAAGQSQERNVPNNETEQTSRRKVLQGGLTAVAAGVAAGAMARTAKAQEKLAQNLVQYQDMPKDGAKCLDCTNWVAPNGCKIVDGKISPNGWCVAFAPKG